MRISAGLLGIAVVLVACAGGKPRATSPPQDNAWLVNLATQKVGDNVTIEANRDASFTLCWKDKETESKVPAVQFIIVRMSDHKIVEEGSATMGEVRWISDYEVEVSHRQGQVQLERGPQSNTRIISVKKYLDVVGR